jgi:hypothetical protein
MHSVNDLLYRLCAIELVIGFTTGAEPRASVTE